MRYSFVDTRNIWDSAHVIRRFHQARKYPEPLLLSEHPKRPWEYGGVSLPTVVRHDDRFRMWYLCGGVVPGDPSFNSDVNAYAESRDGIHWERPDLGLLEYKGSRKNNLVPLFGIWPSVFHGIADTEYEGKLLAMTIPSGGPRPESRYSYRSGLAQQMKHQPGYMDADLHGRKDRLHYDAFPEFIAGERSVDPYGGWLAWFSQDGLDWHLVQKETVIPGTSDAGAWASDPYSRRIIGAPKLEVQVGDHIRRCLASMATSDITDWEWPRLALVPDELDDVKARERGLEFAEFYGMPILPQEGFCLGGLQVFYGKRPYVGPFQRVIMHGVVEPQLAWSYDAIRWERAPGREPFISRGEHGDPDAGGIYASSMLEVGDEVFIYYTSDPCQHGTGHCLPTLHPKWRMEGWAEKPLCLQHIRLATLRRDRFASMTAYDEGWVEMKPRAPAGRELFLNARCGHGYVAVEVRDAQGGVIEGFSRDECRLFRGDSLRAAVTWKEKQFSDLDPHKPVILRFYVWDADLFAYEIV